MTEKKITNKERIQQLEKQIVTMQEVSSAIVARASIAARLGYEYGGDRDIYQALGYKKTLDPKDFLTQYLRQDMAKAVIDRPIGATWRGTIQIIETDDDEETALEREWKTLNKALNLKSMFQRADRLTSLGSYGVIFLGFDDAKSREDFRKPVDGGERKLLYTKPLWEESARINTWVSDAGDERFGLPLTYMLSLSSPNGGTISAEVHYTRVIHIPGLLLESETEGVPALESVYNCLKNIEKVAGGSGEMFWRGARPGYQGKIDPEFQFTDTEKEALKDQIDEYENNLRRMIIAKGIDLEALASQVSDPSNHVDIQIQLISAATGIPKRILTGSERGELASDQDRSNWFDFVQERREEHAEVKIVRPFVDRMIEYGVLPEPKTGDGDYTVKWSDLWSVSEKERAEIGKIRSESYRNYTGALTQDVIPPETALEILFGLSADEVELIIEQRDQAIIEEEADAASVVEEAPEDEDMGDDNE